MHSQLSQAHLYFYVLPLFREFVYLTQWNRAIPQLRLSYRLKRFKKAKQTDPCFSENFEWKLTLKFQPSEFATRFDSAQTVCAISLASVKNVQTTCVGMQCNQ